MNQHWPRWIKASTVTHFEARRQDLHFFIEGTDRRTDQQRTYIEFRLDGPFSKELNPNFWELTVEINILVVTNRKDEDIYEHERNVGIVAKAFTPSITVFKYGDSEDDDPISILGCLILLPDNKEKIIISNFGQVKSDSRMLQSTVEAHYRMQLRG